MANIGLSKKRQFSVLLMYPFDDLETYLAHIKARNADEAILAAQEQCAKDNHFDHDEMKELRPILICHGFIKDLYKGGF